MLLLVFLMVKIRGHQIVSSELVVFSKLVGAIEMKVPGHTETVSKLKTVSNGRWLF